jgi:hypothetical protein
MRLTHIRAIEAALSEQGIDYTFDPRPEPDQNQVYVDISTSERQLRHAAVREVLARLGMMQGVDVGHEQQNKGGPGYPSLVIEDRSDSRLTLRDEAAYEKSPYIPIRDYDEEPPF